MGSQASQGFTGKDARKYLGAIGMRAEVVSRLDELRAAQGCSYATAVDSLVVETSSQGTARGACRMLADEIAPRARAGGATSSSLSYIQRAHLDFFAEER